MSDDEVRQTQFAERMLGGLTASAEILAVELGRRLGLYEALAGGTPTNAEHLGIRAGIAERYAREWLEQQAAAGILDVVAPDAPRDSGGGDRRHRGRHEPRDRDGEPAATGDHPHGRRDHQGRVERRPGHQEEHVERHHRGRSADDRPAADRSASATVADASVRERHSRRRRDDHVRRGDPAGHTAPAAPDAATAATATTATAAMAEADAFSSADAAERAAAEREYVLPAALEPLLLDPTHPLNLMGVPPIVVSLAATLPQVAQAYRTGDGVAYAAFGQELRHGIAAMNRPGFTHDLRGWIDTLPDLAARLDAGGTALDAGCGLGWSTIALARAFPRATVIGIDLDEASVAEARANAAAEGLDARRVRFETADAAASAEGTADLVTVFEALHDMGEPVRALESFRRALAPGGAVLVADEKVAEAFAAPASEEERMQYAFSVLHCLPATMAESASVANGTVLRAPTVRRWAAEAGFERVDILPVQHDLWRFYRVS